MTKTITETDLKHAKKSGKSVSEYRAVIRPKRAEELLVPSLNAVFRRDNPIHTNDEKLIAAAQRNGNLRVTINYEAEAKTAEEPKAKAGK